ncbi:NAD(P)H-dependent oxidoreductase [Tamlana agarivorans]|uniref:NAD(P)H-dependent oxidoreductase n=1 Tax=Pseudotamlana agarivorans TaxID=481183 RepID=A0ACC5UCD5_9FLAO|nr:NAD(P)H-dependent oxidoreductase [Tamlana agarivorans]MBU2951944.1 NAD(P)H-dependent oxidoreductase [Tamlana agarivorans]
MKNVIAFAGSNSKSSINKQLAVYAGSLLEDVTVNILDLNDFELPLYGVDLEADKGVPEEAHAFIGLIKNSDGIILSLAEHNGAYSTAFKNLFDWMSRIESKTFFGKPMLLMATSPGGRGGQSVLEIARGRFPFHNAQIIDVFSLPFFNDNFSDNRITEAGFNSDLIKKVEAFKNVL